MTNESYIGTLGRAQREQPVSPGTMLKTISNFKFDGDNASIAVTCDVHAQDVGEVAKVFGFEPIAEWWTYIGSPKRCCHMPRGVVSIDANRGEDPMLKADVNAWV
jgi:hypothetical protein